MQGIQGSSDSREISNEIKEYIPIDLSLARDRIGNIIFQFPITLLKVNSRAAKDRKSINLRFYWHPKVERKINCTIRSQSTLDNNIKEKDVWEYYSRDVYDMITLWPWLTVSEEFYYFSQNNEMTELAELDQFLRF